MAVNTLISVKEAVEMTEALFIDCRFNLADPSAGRNAYEAEHIPQAVYADLEQDLSGKIVTGKTGRHPLPDVAELTKTFSELGISNQKPVIAYDADNGAFASRLWWLLRHLGHGSVWVLNGGLKAWRSDGQPTSSQATSIETSAFTAATSLCQVVDATQIPGLSNSLIDAREEARFRGEQEPIDPVAGHIPNATCMPFSQNLDEVGLFKTPEVLRQQFVGHGISGQSPAICYCGSGVTACHNILAIRHAGLPEPFLYPGSWSEWVTDPTRPIATKLD